MNLGKSNLLLVAGLLGLLGGAPLQASAHSHPEGADKMAVVTTKAIETRLALRDLWVSHAFWVRNVAQEILLGNEAAAAAAELEAVANAKAIAAAIEPFYGKPASDKLFTLLAGHYTAVKQYAEATAANSAARQDAAQKDLLANAQELAKFLSSANPNLPMDAVLGMLLAHGGHHILQIQELKAGQYGDEAKTWNAMKLHMFAIADALTNAIAKQFPDKFQ